MNESEPTPEYLERGVRNNLLNGEYSTTQSTSINPVIKTTNRPFKDPFTILTPLLLLQQLRNTNNPPPPPPHLRQHPPQHRNRPPPTIMTNNNPPRAQHTQHMSRINPPIRYLRIVRVYTTEHEFVIQFGHEVQHPRGEEARAGAEVFRRLFFGEGGVGAAEEGFYGADLRGEMVVAEGAGGLVAHGVVC